MQETVVVLYETVNGTITVNVTRPVATGIDVCNITILRTDRSGKDLARGRCAISTHDPQSIGTRLGGHRVYTREQGVVPQGFESIIRGWNYGKDKEGC